MKARANNTRGMEKRRHCERGINPSPPLARWDKTMIVLEQRSIFLSRALDSARGRYRSERGWRAEVMAKWQRFGAEGWRKSRGEPVEKRPVGTNAIVHGWGGRRGEETGGGERNNMETNRARPDDSLPDRGVISCRHLDISSLRSLVHESLMLGRKDGSLTSSFFPPPPSLSSEAVNVLWMD